MLVLGVWIPDLVAGCGSNASEPHNSSQLLPLWWPKSAFSNNIYNSVQTQRQKVSRLVGATARTGPARQLSSADSIGRHQSIYHMPSFSRSGMSLCYLPFHAGDWSSLDKNVLFNAFL